MNYVIPNSNPFVMQSGARGEIFAYGLRNPFRWSFDHLTGDLTIGDVGQSAEEEWNFAAKADGGGRGGNFGWSYYEGNRLNTEAASPIAPGTFPQAYLKPALAHPQREDYCSAIGGRVGRDRRMGEYRGRYVYGDLCKGEVRSTILSTGSSTDDRPTGLNVSMIVSVDEDDRCRLYIVSLEGGVWRLDPQGASAAAASADAGCEETPTVPVAPGPAAPSAPVPAEPVRGPVIDRLAPVLSKVSALRKRFTVRRGTYFRLTSNEAGDAADPHPAAGLRAARGTAVPRAAGRRHPCASPAACAGPRRAP